MNWKLFFKMSAKKDKLQIRQFKNSLNDFWVGMKHYKILEDNSVLFVCGGICDEEETEEFKAYIKRNKKVYR